MEYKIEIKDKTEVTTDAGVFVMSNELFHNYFNHFRPKQADFGYNFAYYLARATVPDSYAFQNNTNPSWYDRELDEKIRQWADKIEICPREHLSKYHERTEKTDELFHRITPEISDLLARSRLFGHFTFYGIDRMIWLEHRVIAGSFQQFFNNPFMAGYSPDLNVQKQARKRRKEQMLDRKKPFLIGIPILMNNQEFMYGGDINQYFEAGTRLLERDQEKVRKALKKFNSLQFDYARAVFSPVQFDDSLVAIPEPSSLEFIANKEVQASVKDAEFLESLRIKKSDIIPGEEIDKVSVRLITNNGMHNLTASEPITFWFDNYYQRLQEII